MGRAHPRNSAHSLLEARRSPGNINVHHDIGVLEIHAFAEQVGRQKQIDPLRGDWWPSVERSGGEARKGLPARQSAASDLRPMSCEHCDATQMRESAKEHRNGLSVLRERDDFGFRVRGAKAGYRVGPLDVE
jgi:hypothetical protein